MNAASRRLRYREELHADILRAASELFVREGYESFSMRKLAEKIGYSHGSIYLYFKNKEQLFDCLVEDSFAQLYQRLQQIEDADPVGLLKKAGRAYVDFGLENPNAYEFAFLIRRTDQTRPWRPHAAMTFLRGVVERCIREKRFRAVDVDTTCQALWAAVHGITSLLILRPSFPWADRERLIGQVIDSSIDSLLAGPKSGRRKGEPRGKRDPR